MVLVPLRLEYVHHDGIQRLLEPEGSFILWMMFVACKGPILSYSGACNSSIWQFNATEIGRHIVATCILSWYNRYWATIDQKHVRQDCPLLSSSVMSGPEIQHMAWRRNYQSRHWHDWGIANVSTQDLDRGHWTVSLGGATQTWQIEHKRSWYHV
jgi:hypothetical protein